MSAKELAESKVAIFGLLVAVLVAAGLLLAAKPAYAATFTVNSTGDAGDQSPGNGSCSTGSFIVGVGVECTLRAAIQEANATARVDTIGFNIPGSGVKTISPTSKLPDITETVTIDGYTQPGASENLLGKGTNAVLKIELSGENAVGATAGLLIGPLAPDSVVRGLAIYRFGRGIQISSTSVKVEGNFIGTDASGTQGLGNREEGILLGNSQGIIIGGTAPAARNLISGNGREGIRMATGEGRTLVLGNLIGTSKDGSTPMGNSDAGVFIHGTHGDNTVGGSASGAASIIAFNGRDGVSVDDFIGEFVPLRDRIVNNSIFSNGRLGIDLVGGAQNAAGATANDPGDTDTGPNNLQNKPVLTSAVTSGDVTTIQANLNSTPDSTFVIRFFSNPSGNEGKQFTGQKSVTTDSNGNVSFSFSSATAVPAGQTITTAATNSGGDTSEFSAAREVTRP